MRSTRIGLFPLPGSRHSGGNFRRAGVLLRGFHANTLGCWWFLLGMQWHANGEHCKGASSRLPVVSFPFEECDLQASASSGVVAFSSRLSTFVLHVLAVRCPGAHSAAKIQLCDVCAAGCTGNHRSPFRTARHFVQPVCI